MLAFCYMSSCQNYCCDFQKKHSNSKRFKASENIEFPDVPPEVLEKETVKGHVEEMKKWFKAWKDQDDSKRDYNKYFKPILCYMEGFWVTTNIKDFDELLGYQTLAGSPG